MNSYLLLCIRLVATGHAWNDSLHLRRVSTEEEGITAHANETERGRVFKTSPYNKLFHIQAIFGVCCVINIDVDGSHENTRYSIICPQRNALQYTQKQLAWPSHHNQPEHIPCFALRSASGWQATISELHVYWLNLKYGHVQTAWALVPLYVLKGLVHGRLP